MKLSLVNNYKCNMMDCQPNFFLFRKYESAKKTFYWYEVVTNDFLDNHHVPITETIDGVDKIQEILLLLTTSHSAIFSIHDKTTKEESKLTLTMNQPTEQRKIVFELVLNYQPTNWDEHEIHNNFPEFFYTEITDYYLMFDMLYKVFTIDAPFVMYKDHPYFGERPLSLKDMEDAIAKFEYKHGIVTFRRFFGNCVDPKQINDFLMKNPNTELEHPYTYFQLRYRDLYNELLECSSPKEYLNLLLKDKHLKNVWESRKKVIKYFFFLFINKRFLIFFFFYLI